MHTFTKAFTTVEKHITIAANTCNHVGERTHIGHRNGMVDVSLAAATIGAVTTVTGSVKPATVLFYSNELIVAACAFAISWKRPGWTEIRTSWRHPTVARRLGWNREAGAAWTHGVEAALRAQRDSAEVTWSRHLVLPYDVCRRVGQDALHVVRRRGRILCNDCMIVCTFLWGSSIFYGNSTFRGCALQ